MMTVPLQRRQRKHGEVERLVQSGGVCVQTPCSQTQDPKPQSRPSPPPQLRTPFPTDVGLFLSVVTDTPRGLSPGASGPTHSLRVVLTRVSPQEGMGATGVSAPCASSQNHGRHGRGDSESQGPPTGIELRSPKRQTCQRPASQASWRGSQAMG